MDRIGLNTNYIQVVDVDGTASYGGSQLWFKEESLDIYRQGCGVIAAVDACLYMTKTYRITRTAYIGLVDDFIKHRFLMRLFLKGKRFAIGVVPAQITSYLNAGHFFTDSHRFIWNGRHGHIHMYDSLKEMLIDEIPVIWGLYFVGKTIRLYTCDSQGHLVDTGQKINNHYVTVTGVLEDTDSHIRIIEVSSWGKRYYIDYEEYLQCCGKSLISGYCSNIVAII